MHLTDKQSAVLDYIRERRTEGFAMPTVREIQQQFGFSSPFAATRHIMALEKKGFLNRAGGRARSMILNDPHIPRWLNIPLLGAIPAGLPVEAVEQPDRCIAVDADTIRLQKNSRTFALEVRGDSMIDAGILDGDFIVARAQTIADPGDIVIAGIPGDEGTVKTYTRAGDKVVLLPANPALSPMEFDPSEVAIYGKVVTVMRKL